MDLNQFTFANRPKLVRFINKWDLGLILIIFAAFFFLGEAANQVTKPYALGQQLPISLAVSYLPQYALYTVLRLFVALFASMLFTLAIGTLAAKYKRAEMIIIPALDILQSVPVLSFLSITVAGFIQLFPGKLLGPECACLFAIFTSQAWNMTFSFYQSLKTFPAEFLEVAHIFQLSSWQKFWKLEVPFSLSALIWNMMMSMSASWFFVVLSEAIQVAHQNIRLPGIGSYIALAVETKNLSALGYAILTMMIVIFLYDQLVFRPLVVWVEKFKLDASPEDETNDAWLLNWIRGSTLLKRVFMPVSVLKDCFLNDRRINRLFVFDTQRSMPIVKNSMDIIWYCLLLLVFGGLAWCFWVFAHDNLTVDMLLQVLLLGTATAIRVIIAIVLSSVIWIPIGVFIGFRPILAGRIQPLIQMLAAFPVNLFYPLFVIGIIRFHLNASIWVTPLMILSAQWYILFNVIAGTLHIPRDLCLAANNFGLKGWLWWRRLALPGIFPFYITGMITASGAAWNASIVAECVSWGSDTLNGFGLGTYIKENTIAGNFPQVALGTCVMCGFVLLFNHVLWRPLYRLAEERFC